MRGQNEPQFQCFVDNRQVRGVLPEVAVPQGVVQVTGIDQVPSTKRLFLMPDWREPADRRWTGVDLENVAELAMQALQPVVLLHDAGDAVDGLVRRWAAPEDAKHIDIASTRGSRDDDCRLPAPVATAPELTRYEALTNRFPMISCVCEAFSNTA